MVRLWFIDLVMSGYWRITFLKQNTGLGVALFLCRTNNLGMCMSKTVYSIIRTKSIIVFIFLLYLCVIILQSGSYVLAATLSQSELQALNEYPNWVANYCTNTGSAFANTSTSSGAVGSFTINQVETFASEPITTTWNISNSTVEQWFLKQAGSWATVSKYGLNSSNIGQVTAAVEAANVSPVFFYLYAVNEGGGAGGFINHYSSDIPGGGPANAARDAAYLATQSANKSGGPATGGGEPSDMPTADAQQILTALPSGSIGVVYIQATSAVTAELEYLSGKSGDWNPGDSASPATQFGSPLEEAMKNIQTMGGNPSQGGTTISAGNCAATGTTAQGMSKAISWAVMIANNKGYGYSEAARTTGWAKYQSDPTCSTQCGYFDCSSLVAAALTEAGYFKTNPEFDTLNEGQYLQQAGFTQVATSATTSANLQPGDILINQADHTAIYIGNNQLVEAANPSAGIHVTTFYNYPWDSVWRASS